MKLKLKIHVKYTIGENLNKKENIFMELNKTSTNILVVAL